LHYEDLNRYVKIAISLFAVSLYIAMVYAGFAEFMARVSKRGERKKRSRSRGAVRSLRNEKKPI